MPLSLFELNSMNREQLEALAKEYGITATKKLDDENLAFAIIDKQAIVESQNRSPKSLSSVADVLQRLKKMHRSRLRRLLKHRQKQKKKPLPNLSRT